MVLDTCIDNFINAAKQGTVCRPLPEARLARLLREWKEYSRILGINLPLITRRYSGFRSSREGTWRTEYEHKIAQSRMHIFVDGEIIHERRQSAV
jgi:hypothetical protein